MESVARHALAVLIALATPSAAWAMPRQVPLLPPAPIARPATPAPPTSRVALPAVREGVLLTGVRGYIARSLRDPGLLVFRIEERLAASVRRSLTLLPSDATNDVKALVADPTEDTPSYFELTGEVFDYGDRAFVLPVAIIALRNPPAPEFLARTAPPDPDAPRGRLAADPPRPPRIDAWADAEAARLEPTPIRDVPADRLAHEPDPGMFPGLDDGLADRLERLLDAGIAASGTGTAVKGPLPEFDRSRLLSSATRILGRRASVLRDPLTGVWRARFATGIPSEGADAAAPADASMEILPSRTLQTLERSIRQRPVGTEWLLSGEIVVAGDRNYLLLTRAVEPPRVRFESP
ncbi:MAG: hypothetical protein RI990_1262 [Planctomycetota bacterium]|jgi:hypothetical protein